MTKMLWVALATMAAGLVVVVGGVPHLFERPKPLGEALKWCPDSRPPNWVTCYVEPPRSAP